MRPLAVFIISIGLIALIGGYLNFANSITPKAIDVSESPATGKYDLHLTLPFDAKPSYFSSIGDPESIVIRFRGKVIYRSLDVVPAGTPVIIKNVPEIKVGENEFHVYVSPGDSENPSSTSENKSLESSNDPFNTQDLEFGPSNNETGNDNNGPVEIHRAIKLTIFEQGIAEPVVSQTLWSGDQAAVEGTVNLVILARGEDHESTHVH